METGSHSDLPPVPLTSVEDHRVNHRDTLPLSQGISNATSNSWGLGAENGHSTEHPTAGNGQQGHAVPQQPTGSQPSQQDPTTFLTRALAYIGHGPRGSLSRKSLVRVIWNLSWGFLQVCFLVYLMTCGTIQLIRSLPSLSC